jgi:hypothetical protein
MIEKLTKQGVRDLGGNARAPRRRCRHVWGPFEHLRTEMLWGAVSPGDPCDRKVYGRRCLHCPETDR